MRNQRGKMSGLRLNKAIVSLTLALMLLCGNLTSAAPGMLNALALEVAETSAPVQQAVVEEAAAPQTETPAEPAPQGETPPAADTSATDSPAAEADAVSESPATDAPEKDTPATESGETETPETPAADTPATDTPATDEPTKTDAPATDTPATDTPATDAPVADERSLLQRAIEDENGSYVDVQSGKVYENQSLNKLMGVLDGGLAFATEYTVREDGEDSVRVIFRTEDDSLLIGYIPASRATELGRQQTIDELTSNGVTFLFNKEPDLPLSVIGFTYAQPETEQGDSENPPAEEEAPTIVVEEIEPYVAAAIRNSVNLRKEPSTSGSLMAQLDKGVRMTVRGKLTNAQGELWYYVTYHQNPYYVMAELVEAVDASTEQPAESDTPADTETNPDTPADEVFDFVFMTYPGELPVMITANGDDYYTHTAADGTLTLLAYGSFKGGEPAFYAVNENEIVQTDAPFGMDAPALELTVEPDEEEAVDPFVQMEYAGDPITGITANGDGYYTYSAPDGAVTLLVYGSANSGEPAFYALDEELVINLTAPFVPEATPTAAPETDDELVFMPLMPDSSAVPEYYQLVSAPSTTEEAEPAASAFLNWLIPRACAEEEVPEPTGDSDTPDENAGETQPSAPAQESTPKYIYSFTVDNKGISETYYRVYGSLKRKNGEVIAVGFFACDKDGSFDTSNYMLIDPKDDFVQMNAEDKEAALITMLKTLPTLAEVEALVTSDAAGTAATLASTEATLESISQQMDALQLNMSSDEQTAFTTRLTEQTPEGMQNYADLTAYFANVHAQQLADVQAAIDALPTVEAVQAMDVTAEDYAQRFAVVETDTAAAQTLLTSYKATLSEADLVNLEALLGTPEAAESNGEAPAEGAPAEGELLTEAASQPTRLVKLNDLTAYFADKRFEAMVRELQAAVATLPTAETLATMTMDSDEYLAAKTQYNAAWTTLQSLYAQMIEADKARFAADERVLAALQAMTDLFTYFENNEIPYMQTAIDGMPDPYWTGFLAELLYSDTDNSASMYDLPTGETPAGETPAEAPAGEAPAGETAGETPATDAIDPAAAEAKFLANLQEVYDGLGLTLDPDDPRAAGDELFAELWAALGDVQPRTAFLTHDAVDTEAGQAYLDEKLGVQEGAETTRLEKYNTLLGIMQGISGIQTLAETADLLTADWVYVSKLEVTKIVDGVAPFDTNPSATAADYSGRPGNDASDSNKLVRTFDGITYNMTITTALHDDAAVSAVKNGYLYYEFIIPGYSAKEATFNTTAMSWIGTPVTDLASVPAGQSGYMLTEGASSVTIRGKYYCTPSGGSANAFPGQVLPYATVRVNAAKNGDEIQPTFKWWADFNTETGNCPTHGVEEPKSVTADKVKVTAQLRMNVQLKQAGREANYVKGVFDFASANPAAMDADAGVVTGRMVTYGITLQLYNDNTNNGLKGLECPTGPITFDLDLSSQFVPDGGTEQNTTGEYAPLVWSFGESAYAGTSQDGRDQSIYGNRAYAPAVVPLNRLVAASSEWFRCCYNGGSWSATKSDNKVSVTVSGYEINADYFPTSNIDHQPTVISYGANIGCFSAGEIFIVQPFYNEDGDYILNDYHTTSGDLSMTIADSKLTATSVSGQALSATAGTDNQIVQTDDRIKSPINLKVPGTYQPRITWTYTNDNAVLFLDVMGGTTYLQRGEDYITLAGRVTIGTEVVNYENGDADNRLIAYNQLVKFDSRLGEPTGTLRHDFVDYFGMTATCLYATKADGAPWTSDSEMNAASMTDLKYYASTSAIPAGHACIGYLIEVRPLGAASDVKFAVVGTHGVFNHNILLNTSDLTLLGDVFQTVHETVSWDMLDYTAAQVKGGIPSLLTNNPVSPTALPKATYSAHPNYVKAYYDENGYAGGHNGGFEYGDSLYIVPWQATITKSIAQQENGADKKIYITSSGQRVVDFKMQPKLSSGMATASSAATTVTITDTLPAKITYIPGSTYFGSSNAYVQNAEPGRQGTVTGGVNTEPTAVKNPNGTTTLTWLLENVPVDVTMPTIYYSCDIGQEGAANDVVNNEQFTNTVQIKAEGDKREVNVANGNLATAGFSISSIGAAAISKIPISRYNEPGDAFGWTMNAGNNGGSVISNAMVLDTMPENGYQGSSFTTPLKVASWKINTTKLTNFAAWHAFYTVSTGANRTKVNQYTAADILNAPHQSTVGGNTITWVEVGISADGSVNVPGNVSPTALILIGNLGIGAACETTLMVDALTDSTKANEIYVNQLSNGDTTTTSRSYIIGRTLDGVAWLDANYNGQRNGDEAQLAGVTVTLYKLKDGQNPALESSYEPVLVNGNPATVTTGATNNAMNLADGSLTTYAPDAGDTGRYKFIGLNAGTYAVKFSGTTIAPYRASPVDTGADTLDSDGKPTYTGATLTSTFIPNIVMPTKENMATFQYDDHYHDSGFDVYRIEFTVGKTVAGNAADRTKTFEFTLTFANKADFAGQSFAYVGGSTVTGVAAPDNGTLTLDADGKATIRLKHGQTITVKGVPVGATNTVQVTEASPVSEGYAANYTYTVGTTAKATNVQSNETTALKTSDSAPSAGNAEAQKVAFTNTRTITVPTGILLDIWPYLLILAVAMGGVAWLLISKRKSNHKKQNGDNRN